MVNLFSLYEKRSHAGTNFPERQTKPEPANYQGCTPGGRS